MGSKEIKMSSECTHNCDSCGASCSSRENTRIAGKDDFKAELNKDSKVGHVIGVVSGKGGVGKSLVTSMLAVYTRAKGYKVGILDADITGPSIPKAFGIDGHIGVTEDGGMVPVTSTTGIDIISSNLLLDNETDPIIWRGPVIAGAVKQFWSETVWQNIDYMFVDMPPGTGDVPLTVFQSLPVEGIVIVTSPQELVSMIVAKAVHMAEQMDIPVLGLIENMSYYTCPDCGKKHSIFGESHIDEIAKEYGLKVLAKLPINSDIASSIDAGRAEYIDLPELRAAADEIIK